MIKDEKFFQTAAEADYFDFTGTLRQAKLNFTRQEDVIFCCDEKAGIHFQICLRNNGDRMNAVIPANSRKEEKDEPKPCHQLP